MAKKIKLPDSLILAKQAGGRIKGTAENDIILGSAATDILLAAKGKDKLAPGKDKNKDGDKIIAGGGDDVVVHAYDELGGSDEYDGGNGTDTLALHFTADQWDALNGGNWALRDMLRSFGEELVAAGRKVETFLTFAAMDITARGFENFVVVVNDAVVSLDDAGVVALTASVTADASDTASVDLSTQVTAEDGLAGIEITSAPEQGTVSIEDGVATFVPGSEFDALSAGETQEITYTYTATDADGDTASADVSVTVVGVNNAPQTQDISVEVTENLSNFARTEAVDEGRTVLNAGGFHVLDAATGELTFVPRGPAGLVPDDVAPTDGIVVYINPNTSNWFIEVVAYSEGVATAIDPSSFTVTGYEGETLLRGDSYYFLGDTNGVSISVDLPEIQTPNGAADGTLVLDGLNYVANANKVVDLGTLNLSLSPVGTEAPIVIAPQATDPDAGDTMIITVDDSETQGVVTLTGNGDFFYDQNQAFGYLGEGETAIDTFRYTATDDAGATSTSTVSVTVNGTNDGPDASALFAEVYAEDSQVQALAVTLGQQTIPNAGIFYVLDCDTGALTTIARNGTMNTVNDIGIENGMVLLVNPNTNSVYLSAAIFENGTATAVDPMSLAPEGYQGATDVYGDRLVLLDAVADGTVALQVDELMTRDGMAVAGVTLTGFDYAGPGLTETVTIDGANADASAAPSPTSITLTAEVYDPDDTVFTYSIDTTGTRGDVIDNGDGAFTYAPNGAFDYLDSGKSALDLFTYTVTDASGASDTETVTVTNIGTVTTYDDVMIA